MRRLRKCLTAIALAGMIKIDLMTRISCQYIKEETGGIEKESIII